MWVRDGERGYVGSLIDSVMYKTPDHKASVFMEKAGCTGSHPITSRCRRDPGGTPR
jgi:hypothetical protein